MQERGPFLRQDEQDARATKKREDAREVRLGEATRAEMQGEESDAA
jgi:hypothetical protein